MYNHAHMGDVFVSRGVVKWICTNIPAEGYVYEHRYSPKIVRDMHYVKSMPYERNETRQQPWTVIDGVLRANVSYMPQTPYYKKTSIETLWLALKGELKRELGIDVLATEEDLIPEMSYDKYDVSKIDEFMKSHQGKKVLVCNNETLSGQARNFNMNPLISTFSEKFPELHFIVTNEHKGRVAEDNVSYVTDMVVAFEGSDLPECAYAGTFCDLIISRGSGPATYCLSKTHLERTTLKYVGFCDHIEPMAIGLNKFYEGKFFNKFARDHTEAISYALPFVQALDETP